MEIKIQDLSKTYNNGNRAIKKLDLSIENGMFGLLGPNGAGKSTLMKILVTLMKPSEGKIFVNEMDLQKNRKKIRKMLGYLPQDFRFFAKLRTWEFLEYSARLAGVKGHKNQSEAIEKMLEQVGLYEVRDRFANKLSGGMKRRLGIAQALIGDPKIVIVDEPTTGLDPEERIRFRNLLSNLSRKEIIIILSTHIVGDISSICRNMAILEQGNLAFSGSPDDLIEQAKGHVWQVQANQEQYDFLKQHYAIIASMPSINGWELQLVGDDLKGIEAKAIDPNLEHAYVYFMESIGKSKDNFSSANWLINDK